mmetsp:Transcript_26190/g.90376  ORF Transcript_26190/g.90376 Transcript_26190/m.90376 type:complete len:249 (-) Transcript_26190:223-969(-)
MEFRASKGSEILEKWEKGASAPSSTALQARTRTMRKSPGERPGTHRVGFSSAAKRTVTQSFFFSVVQSFESSDVSPAGFGVWGKASHAALTLSCVIPGCAANKRIFSARDPPTTQRCTSYVCVEWPLSYRGGSQPTTKVEFVAKIKKGSPGASGTSQSVVHRIDAESGPKPAALNALTVATYRVAGQRSFMDVPALVFPAPSAATRCALRPSLFSSGGGRKLFFVPFRFGDCEATNLCPSWWHRSVCW